MNELNHPIARFAFNPETYSKFDIIFSEAEDRIITVDFVSRNTAHVEPEVVKVVDPEPVVFKHIVTDTGTTASVVAPKKNPTFKGFFNRRNHPPRLVERLERIARFLYLAPSQTIRQLSLSLSMDETTLKHDLHTMRAIYGIIHREKSTKKTKFGGNTPYLYSLKPQAIRTALVSPQE